jgi:hypothetical protein
MQIIPVNQYYQHPDWNPDLVANDLMLLHLQHAPTGGLTPVTRATPAQDPADDVTTNVIGWGLTVVNSDGTDAPPNRANETSVEVVGTDACQSAWSGIASVTGNQICVLHKNPTQHSACNGDSGGPLLSGGRQVGIVSFGVGGCTAQAPEVMTRVSSYNSWIDGSMDKTLAPVDSASLSFGTVNVDKGTVTKSISFLSDGNQPITVFDAVASGDYKVSSSTCSGAIPPGQTCAISVTFNPSAGGIRDGGLTVNTDSQGTAHLTTSLTGMGLGRSNTPVKLHLTRSGAKYVGGKYKVSFRMNFKVPTGVPMAAACKGKLGLKMSVAGKHYSTKSKVGVVPPFLGRAPRCFTRFNFKVNASALGRKATLKLAFPKNEVLVASRSTKRFRIR